MSGLNQTAVSTETRPAPRLDGQTIAVIGLGSMGRGMAQRLGDAGASLRLYNRTRRRGEELLSLLDVTVAGSPREAANGADVVLVSVADDAALRAVLTGSDGVLAARPALVLNTSTVAPATVRELAEDVAMLDVGVLGNADHARTGALRCYVGGPKTLVRAAEPVLDALGRQVLHVGELGSGMALKLVMNMVMGVEMQVLAEAVALGEAAGLDRQTVLAAISGSGFAAPVMRHKAGRMTARSYAGPDFRLRLMAKDLALAVDQARPAGVDLPMVEAAARCHDAAVQAGLGEADCAAIAQFFERTSEEAR